MYTVSYIFQAFIQTLMYIMCADRYYIVLYKTNRIFLKNPYIISGVRKKWSWLLLLEIAGVEYIETVTFKIKNNLMSVYFI